MTTILDQRTPSEMIGHIVSQGIQQGFPQGIQQGMERGRGISALNQMEKDLAAAQGDPVKMASAFAKGVAQNPGLERAAGPLFQTALQESKLKNAFGGNGGAAGVNNTQVSTPGSTGGMQGQSGSNGQVPKEDLGMPKPSPTQYATPGPFNVFTPNKINEESERYANALRTPDAYGTRQAQLENLNTIATNQRKDLEDSALKSGVSAGDLPRFMNVGSKFDPSNPSEWMQNTKREYDKVKNNDDKIQNAFIPGLGSGLIGKNRDAALKKLIPTIQDQIQRGQEQETRKFLADEYLSPTEIEELIHPLTKEKEQKIKSLPKGVFPQQKTTFKDYAGLEGERPSEQAFISYEEALERAPQQLQKMQDRLSNFFLENVDDNTSLLTLREKLVDDRDYDWRQIGPAIREAEKKGLKLNPDQSTEMTELETQAPRQSLPDVLQDFDRVIQYFRGNK